MANGKVEGMVGFARRTFMVPIPSAPDIGTLNAMLLERCRDRLAAVLRGAEGASIGARLDRDRAAFMDLPATPFDACDKRPGRVSSLSLVRYRNTDYSVPVAYAHHDVMVKAYVDEIVIEAGAEEIARHRRSYETEDFVFDPLHYLELLDRKARLIDRRIRAAKFPATKSLESFDFDAIPQLNKKLVLDLARGEFVSRRENVIAFGPSGVGKTHVALGLGLAACQRGNKTRFATAAAIVHDLIEARDERRLLRLQKLMASVELLIIGELGFAPLSKTGAELLFELLLGDCFAFACQPTDQPALRAELHHHYLEPALRRVDRHIRRGASHRRASRPPDPPRPHPRDERTLLPPRSEPGSKNRLTSISSTTGAL